mgnify:CR=1 FL=1
MAKLDHMVNKIKSTQVFAIFFKPLYHYSTENTRIDPVYGKHVTQILSHHLINAKFESHDICDCMLSPGAFRLKHG